jgi:hypothetical protein
MAMPHLPSACTVTTQRVTATVLGMALIILAQYSAAPRNVSRTLFITASKGLYGIRMRVSGANAAK